MEAIPILLLDRAKLQQAFFNLLGNSVKYAFDDPFAFNVDIGGVDHGDYVRIYIRDYGCGVPESLRRKIFDQGVRAYQLSGSKAIRGQGLGLWIVRRIVEAHTGVVELTNNSLPTEISIFLPTSKRQAR